MDASTTATTTDGAGSPPPPTVRLEIDADSRVNWALEHNGVPVVREARVLNDGVEPLTDVVLEFSIEPGFAPVVAAPLANVPGGAAGVVSRPDLRLDATRLRSTTERDRATLSVVAKVGGVEVARLNRPIDVLARNEWNAAAPPELLAAFVLPNDRGVARILREARALLEEATRDGKFDGYASRSPARARAMAESIYRALQRFDVGYLPPPASFEDDGQKVRPPCDVLDQRAASCLDFATTFAACLEQVDLSPLILIFEGHAFPAVRLVPDAPPDAILDDVARLRRLVLSGEILPIEATTAAARPAAPFKDAVGAAEDLLHGDVRAFRHAIDVRAARRLGVLPLPLDAAPGVAGFAPPSGRAAAADVAEAATSPYPEAPPPPRAPDDAAAAKPAAPRQRTRVDAWKEQLLDLSLRNRLLNFKEGGKLVLPLHGDDPASLEDVVASGDAAEIAPEVSGGASTRDAALAAARGADAAAAAERLRSLRSGVAISKLAADELKRRSTLIARAAKAEIAETGGSSLFLALGALRWFESDDAEEPRLAPLLLVPATLDRPDGRGRPKLRATEDETRFNPALIEKARRFFGVDLSSLDPPPADDSGVDVRATLDFVRKAFARRDRFEVVDGAWVAFFAFSKFLLWRDLDLRADVLLKSPHVARLARLENAPPPESDDFPDPRALESSGVFDASRLVLDADSSQHAAIAAALSGKSFVLQGPPGTGKSQTIANIVAGAIGLKKRVLFVAEKRAALDVVAKRLKAVGLADACLELHADGADARAVAAELARVLEEAERVDGRDVQGKAEAARATARALKIAAQALHAESALGVSVFEAHARTLALKDAPRAPIDAATVGATDAATHRARIDAAKELAAAAADLGLAPKEHPFARCAVSEWTPHVARDVENALRAIGPAAATLRAATTEAAALLQRGASDRVAFAKAAIEAADLLAGGLPAGAAGVVSSEDRDAKLRRLETLAETTRAIATLRANLEPRWAPAFFEKDLAPVVADYRRNADAVAVYRFFALRGSRGVLKNLAKGELGEPEAVLRDLEAAEALAARRRDVAKEDAFAAPILGAAWRGGDTPSETIERLVAFCRAWTRLAPALSDGAAAAPPPSNVDPDRARAVGENLRAALSAFDAATNLVARLLDVDAAFMATFAASAASALDQAERWLKAAPSLRKWTVFARAERRAEDTGLRAAIAAARAGNLPYRALAEGYERAFLDAWLDLRLSTDEGLKAFDGRVHDRATARYVEADRDWVAAGGRGIAAEAAARRPERDAVAPAASEAGLVLAEARKKRRRLPVRRLFERIPNLLPRLKPCLLANPLAVARFLPPDAEPFDLVVFDEASQIPTADAVGAIARGRCVVVVGDARQLPPTTFFEAVGEDDVDDADLGADLESVLDDLAAARTPTTTLRWHYRSRDESLIAFSNGRYYDGKLRTFPGAGSREACGVSLRRVEGTFDRSKTRTNRAEAEAIVAEIAARLTDPARRERSIGVVTFNQPQKLLIEDLLDLAREERPEIEPYFGDAVPEPVFVKNLENVQGDERDVMLFSITYGPDAEGRVAMTFGPLNRAGGERRLNVAVTRAREKLVVFSSMGADAIDLSRTAALGAAHLKAFLRYAGDGASRRIEAASAAEKTTTAFEEDVAAALREGGRVVEVGAGLSDARVDVAVRDPRAPDRYLLGVLCDGRGYRDAATTRDRDRLRAATLERLGWRLERVWTPDWRANRDGEVARLRDAIEAALAEPAPPEPDSANAGLVVDDAAEPREADAARSAAPAPAPPTSDSKTAEGAVVADVYETFAPKVVAAPDDLKKNDATRDVAALVAAIVEREGPVARARVVRVAASAYGVETLGGRVKSRLEDAVDLAIADGRVVARGDFLWRPGDDPATFDRVRTPAPGAEAAREVDHLPPEEIAAAARRVLAASTALPLDALAKATARAFGVRRVTTRVRDVVRQGVDLLIVRDEARLEDDVVRLK